MSMLSTQCDELRAMAESVGLEMPQAATLMMEAADAILELRDDLQRADDAVRDAEHDESRAWDRVRKAEAEADRLRELVRDAWGNGHTDRSCEGCDIRDECHDDIERMRKDGVLRFSRCLFELRIEERMSELGVEVQP